MAFNTKARLTDTDYMKVSNLATANTTFDGSGTIVDLMGANMGADGGIVRGIKVSTRATVAAHEVKFYLSLDGGSTWAYMDGVTFAAVTVATTAAGAVVKYIDKAVPEAAIRLPAGARLGAAPSIAANLSVTTEWSEF